MGELSGSSVVASRAARGGRAGEGPPPRRLGSGTLPLRRRREGLARQK